MTAFAACCEVRGLEDLVALRPVHVAAYIEQLQGRLRLDEELKVYLHREAVDFRLSVNGLAVLVEQALDQTRSLPARRCSATAGATG